MNPTDAATDVSAHAPAPRSCFLIVPLSFYAFGPGIAAHLRDRGWAVTLVNEEYPANVLGKLLGKLRLFGFLRWWTFRTIQRSHPEAPRRFSLVLIVKGRGVGTPLLKWLRSGGARVVAYNFDSFRFNPSPLDWYREVDRYCTFDVEDAQALHLPLVPLYSAIASDAPEGTRTHFLSALMKNHSQRLEYLDEVMRVFPGVPKFIYVYEPNLLSFGWGMLRRPHLYLRYWRHIHFKPMAYTAFVEVLRGSLFTLDYAHPLQSGLTIRCFESRSVGTRLITNNARVLGHPDFAAGAAVHHPIHGDPASLRAQVEAVCRSALPNKARSLAEFVSELLDEPAPAREH